MESTSHEYDVFVSYAVEDKIDIVNDLVASLERAGLRVWYVGRQLRIDPPPSGFNSGFEKSRFGIIVFSENYFRKSWPKDELRWLWSKEEGTGNRLIPVWHNVTEDDLKKIDPVLVKKTGISSQDGVDALTIQLLKRIRKPAVRTHEIPWWPFIVLVILFMSFLRFTFFMPDRPDDDVLHEAVAVRMHILVNELRLYKPDSLLSTGDQALEGIVGAYHSFNVLKTQVRESVEFYNGYQTMSFKDKVNAALGLDVDTLSPLNRYGFLSPDIQLISQNASVASYIFSNTRKASYAIKDATLISDALYQVNVEYQNNIRYISVGLISSRKPNQTKRSSMLIKGFLPVETYIFEKQNGEWRFKKIAAFP